MSWSDIHLRLRNAVGPLLVFLIACALLLSVLQPLAGWNWKLIELMAPPLPAWPGKVVLFDIPWDPDPAKLPDTRLLIADTLKLLAGNKAAGQLPPRLVVVDLALSTLPIGLRDLREAADHLQSAGVRIVVAARPDAFLPNIDFDDSLDRQGSIAIYDAKAAFGHTLFNEQNGTFWYRRCVRPAQLKSARGLWALPYLVQDILDTESLGADCPPDESSEVPFRPGDAEQARSHTWQMQVESKAVRAPQGQSTWGFADKIVVIGNLTHDQVHGRSGPELVAWAIGAQQKLGAMASKTDFRLLNSTGWALGMAMVFSVLCAILSRQLNHRVAALRDWPGFSSLAGWLVTLLALAGVVIFLRNTLDVFFFQVGYVLCSSGAAALISRDMLIRGRRATALHTQVTSSAQAEQGPTHDVFISYSHSPPEDAIWVEKELHKALANAQLNGRNLSVFLDKPSLRVGTRWFVTLAEGIEQSRCVVAIYNRDYFHKGFCQFELEKAMIRFVGQQGRGFALLPFCRDSVVIPVAFNHLQCMQVRNEDQIVVEVLARLQAMSLHRLDSEGEGKLASA